MYSTSEARQLMLRWAMLLVACFAFTAVVNVSFSRYLLAQRERDPETHLALAEARMAAEDFEGARVSVENAFDRAPLYPRVHKVHGDIFFNQGKWADAVRAYRRCLDLDGKYQGVQNNIVWSLIEQESYEEAVALGKRFMVEGEVSHLIPRFVAEAYLRTAQWKDAEHYLKEALKFNPNDTYLLRRLAMAYGKLGNTEQEEETLAFLGEVELELEREQQLTQRPAE